MQGKADFDHVYDCDTPVEYYRQLRTVDYVIPHHAQGVFRRVVERRRHRTGAEGATVVDLCCGYGVNASLLTHDVDLETLYDRYCDPELDDLDRDELIDRDKAWYVGRRWDPEVQTIGLDIAYNAVAYACDVGVLDHGFSENLEADDPSDEFRRRLAGADVIAVTGGLGYVTEQTVGRLVDAATDGPSPWFVAFSLRWVDLKPFNRMFDDRGYTIERHPRTFAQRRFANDDERQYVLAELTKVGIDPAGREDDGNYHAELWVARPAADARTEPLAALLGSAV